MKNSKKSIITPIAISVALVLGVWFGYSVANNYGGNQGSQIGSGDLGYTNKLSYTLQLINSLYVDTIDCNTLVEAVMPELMAQLDPHSAYVPAVEMEGRKETLDGEFDGIGIVFNMFTDTIIVLNVIANGPSYKAGVMPGDRIITVESDTIAGREIPQNDVVKLLRGKRGTNVSIGIERKNVQELVEINITRDKIPIKSIDSWFMIAPNIGYVKLSSFSRTTHTELLEVLEELRLEGMQDLIFDLRGNAGGFLDQAILVADEFLDAGQMIVYTEDRDGEQIKQLSSEQGGSSDLGLVVMIDEYSASSSEIIAGAIQDNDRGTIVGRRSFGKALVQSMIPFSDGSAILLTVARYYTPTGRSIQKPYELGDSDYESDILNRYVHSEFFSADSIHFADSLKFVTPKGKTVYGGGGIMPDIFVPLDTLDMTPYYYVVTGLNILYAYTMEYSDSHREEINNIDTIDELNFFLDSDKYLLDDFVRYAKSKGVEPNYKEILISRNLLTSLLRAYIGRHTKLESTGYFSNIYAIDDALQKSVEVFSDN